MTDDDNKEAINSMTTTQNIIRYAQALGSDAAIYFGSRDQKLANDQRKAMLISGLKTLKDEIDIIDKFLV